MANEIKVVFSQVLSEKIENNIEALPKDFNKQRFVQNAIALCNDKPELAKYPPSLIVQNLIKGAYLGLDFMRKECYLIEYGGKLQFQTDYKGDVKFVRKYSTRPIKDIYAKVIRAGDEFTEKIVDGQPSIDFKPLPFNGNDIVGAFAICLFEDGGMVYETMSVKQINNVRSKYSKMPDSKPWKNSFDEMAKKTVLRRLCKHLTCDFENVEMSKAWKESSDADFRQKGVKANNPPIDVFAAENENGAADVIDGEFEVIDE